MATALALVSVVFWTDECRPVLRSLVRAVASTVPSVRLPVCSYSNLDSRSGKYSRVFNDALSVVGKPNGLRATEWSYDEFCGQTSANGVVYGGGGGIAADLRDKVFGDVGGLIMARLITPPGSRDNTLFIDGQLRGYNAGSRTELVIICIYEELVTQEFAPPQELPISTTRVHVI